jgi:alpha-L-fucosidase
LEIGAWLKLNGEAIYDSTPWKCFGEGPTQIQTGSGHDKDTKSYQAGDFRFTQKGSTVFAIEMAWPADGRAVIHSLGSAQQARGMRITNVELVGSSANLSWRQTDDALEVNMPGTAPGKFAYAFRIQTTKAENSK